jgi:hypothetical protein
MRRSLLFRQIAPSLFWYALLVVSAIGLDYVLHRMGQAWVGRYMGILGTALILLSLLYSARKRKLIERGSPKTLLDLHEYLSWAGALMILVHAGIHFNALLPWLALLLLLVVVASGFVGKNLLKDARDRLKSREAELKKQGLGGDELEKRLLLDSVTVDAMKKWRSVHVPLTVTLATLALLHAVSIMVFWRW